MIRTGTFCIAALAALLFVSCGDGDSDANPSGPAVSTTTETIPYMLLRDTLIMLGEPTLWSSCIGDSLTVDTLLDGRDTLFIELDGNTLRMHSFETAMLDTGVVVKLTQTLTRAGDGEGLVGTWRYGSIGYEAVSGTLSAEDREFYDDMVTMSNAMSRANGGLRVEFTDDEVIWEVPADVMVFDYAEMYIDNWNQSWGDFPSDAERYDVSVVKVGKTQARLTGNRNGEKVTIAWNEDGDMTYTSSNEANPLHTYYQEPVSCPNDYQPDWFDAFLDANAREGSGMRKRRVGPAAAARTMRRGSLFGRVSRRSVTR
jgi:hypothetical protein